MKDLLRPITVNSLKQELIFYFENLILSGKLQPGKKLPPERELAKELAISRPIVHESLVDLAAKGLITIKPRKGTVVNDYRNDGTIALLTSLLDHQRTDTLDPKITDDLLSFRLHMETKLAGLAALKRSKKDIGKLHALLKQEQKNDPRDNSRMAELDFAFHHRVAACSGNIVYPLLINSFKLLQLIILKRFYENESVIPQVLHYHQELTRAIEQKNPGQAEMIMKNILLYGEKELKKLLKPH